MIPQEITYWLDGIRGELIASYNSKGFRASGNYANSLRNFEETRNGKTLIGIKGVGYSYFMENGRKPTQIMTAGNPTLKQRIRKWIDDKNIVPKDKISKDSLAFLIARKIHRFGWQVTGNRANVISGVITPEKIKELNQIIFKIYVQNFTSDVINEFKK